MIQGHKSARIPLRALAHPPVLLACGFGAGLSPVAPGSVGTLLGVGVYALIAGLPLAAYLAVVALLFLAGVWLCAEAGRMLGDQDHAGIVWDEIVGYLLAMTALPPSWLGAAAGYVLFRLFDICKPWPIGVVDRRLPGGLGVMLDDALAGLYAMVCLHILDRVLSFS